MELVPWHSSCRRSTSKKYYPPSITPLSHFSPSPLCSPQIVYKAIDPIKEATDKAKARGVEGVEAISLGDLSSSENTYDIVMCTKSFHHLPSLHEVFNRFSLSLLLFFIFVASFVLSFPFVLEFITNFHSGSGDHSQNT